MLAALRATRRRRPARIVLAVPVASKATLKRLREEADQIVCMATPGNLGSVGSFYQQFAQLRDTEVTELLDKARNFVSSTRAGGP
jgi:predicted phosphoribosyltransferase